MINKWEEECMCCDPFEGDYGGSGEGDGILSDKIVTARKRGPCHTCNGEISPGTRVRRRTEVYDGELMRFGWCQACCETMSDFDAYEERIEMGITARAMVQP